MKKVNATQKNNIFKEIDTGEESHHFDSSPDSYSKKEIIPLKYIFNHGIKSSTLIYYGCIAKQNCPTLLQSVEEIEAALNQIKKIAIDFRKFQNVDIHGIELVGQLVGFLREKKIDFILSPSHASIIQTLIDDKIIHTKKCAKDLTTALRQLSF